MPARIEDYAVIGNGETAALVCRNGAVDWLCMPRFDSAACFAALLGNEANGSWLLTAEECGNSHRAYRGHTLILDTVHEAANGRVQVTDLMTRAEGRSYLLRRVTGLAGVVKMRSALNIRFNYGSAQPWVTQLEDGRLRYVAGPDRLVLECSRPLSPTPQEAVQFEVKEGETIDFVLGWSLSYREVPPKLDMEEALRRTEQRHLEWAGRFPGAGRYSDAVQRSLMTLKALAHFETGGIVAAVTTSLPEQIGGARNWDYRYCWLRDATLTLYALLESNYVEEAERWRHWLERAVAGSPAQLQIMYGVAGERQLDEWEIPWLTGYEDSRPVRVGNAASGQIQLDIYGEVMDALYFARVKGLPELEGMWAIQLEMLHRLGQIWDQPDDGIWEVRGGRQQFTHSKVMAWVAFDRAIRSVEEFGHKGPVEEWRKLRDTIHAQVCAKAFDPKRNSFVQYYGAKGLDAGLLMIALTGFLPPDDPRVIGTVAAIERELLVDGFVRRYRTEEGTDGLEGGEGAFLACSFWLADNYVLQGRMDDARALFERLLALRNDVGLLAEEYDPKLGRQVGNFPQAFSHIALINTAYNLARVEAPAAQRADADGDGKPGADGPTTREAAHG